MTAQTHAEGTAGSGSYRPERERNGLTGEAERLEDQAALSWDEELRLLQAVGVTNGMQLVELGAGSGSFSKRLLESFDQSAVTSVEVRTDLAQLATEHNAGHGDRFRVVQSSSDATGLAPDSHDVAIARLLLQHLEDPVPTVREAMRYLRPGGRFVAIDIDMELWGVVEPTTPALAAVYAKAGQLQSDWGGDRTIGRRLPRILQTAGLEDARLELFAYHSDALGIEAFASQLNPERLLPAVVEGHLSVAEHALAQIEYERFMTDGGFVMLVGFFAHGRVPT